MSVLSSRPTTVLASLDYSTVSVGRVQVVYLTDFEACDSCHRITHNLVEYPEFELVWKSDNLYEKLDKHGWFITCSNSELSGKDRSINQEQNQDCSDLYSIQLKFD